MEHTNKEKVMKKRIVQISSIDKIELKLAKEIKKFMRKKKGKENEKHTPKFCW